MHWFIRRRSRICTLAALSVGCCHALGFGCLQEIFAIIGASFF